jgi:hypothetical protein
MAVDDLAWIDDYFHMQSTSLNEDQAMIEEMGLVEGVV